MIPTSSEQPEAEPGAPMTINCDQCIMQHTSACADCIVTFICSREPNEAVLIDVGELRALRLLSESGLVPGLKHERRTG